MEAQGVAVSHRPPPLLNQPVSTTIDDFQALPSNFKQAMVESSSWSALFSRSNSNVDCSLSFCAPNVVDGVNYIPDEVIEVGYQAWKDYVVGFFVERRLLFPVVREALKRQWKLKADYDMVADKDYFFFKFNLEEDKTTVLEAGLVLIAGRISVQPWSDMTEKEKSQINTIQIWAHLYDVPKKLWSGPGLSCLSSMIGKPLRCDEATARKTRLNYARICVEVKVGVMLPDVLKTKFEGEEYTIHVDYPWKPLSCSDCNTFGHSTGSCKVEKQWKPAPRRQNFVKKGYKQVFIKDKGQTSGSKENEMAINAKSDLEPPSTVIEVAHGLNDTMPKDPIVVTTQQHDKANEFEGDHIVETINIDISTRNTEMEEVVACSLEGNNFLALAGCDEENDNASEHEEDNDVAM